MLNKRLLSDSITLFSKYKAIDENDAIFRNDYSEVVIPTFINNCIFTSKGSYKNNNGINYSIGEVDVVFSFGSCRTQAYRIINGQKIYLTFIDEAAYKVLTLEEQYNKYFTLSSGLTFIYGIYEHSKELDISAIKIKNLETAGFDRHTITSIAKPSKNIVKLTAKIG